MLLKIGIILVILWLLGFSFRIAGSLVHLILVVALIVIVYDLLIGKRRL